MVDLHMKTKRVIGLVILLVVTAVTLASMPGTGAGGYKEVADLPSRRGDALQVPLVIGARSMHLPAATCDCLFIEEDEWGGWIYIGSFLSRLYCFSL